MHAGKRFCNEPFRRRVFLRNPEQAKREVVTVVRGRLRKVTASLQTKNHPEDLRDSTVQPPRDLTYRETLRCAGEELKDIQPFLQSWSGVSAFRGETRFRLRAAHSAQYYFSL
jgi:hypothetical protein